MRWRQVQDSQHQEQQQQQEEEEEVLQHRQQPWPLQLPAAPKAHWPSRHWQLVLPCLLPQQQQKQQQRRQQQQQQALCPC
jgi:hypothetical protein